MRPAPYSKTDYSEDESIYVLKTKIDRKHIKTDIKQRDKVPNYDGYFEIVGDDNVPLGKLEVQIKTLKPQSKVYYCPLELIAYAELTTLPMLVIMVDIKNQNVFWKYIDKSNYNISEKKKSAIITLSSDDLIDNGNHYISQWLNIIRSYQERIKVLDNVSKLVESNNQLVPPSTLSIDIIKYFQAFIDYVNDSINKHYVCLHTFKYPGIWKLGVAIRNVEQGIGYSMYAIPNGHSDLLVKEIKSDAIIDPFKNGILFSHFSVDSNVSPEKLANEFILSSLKSLVKERVFAINDISLCIEYSYIAINKYYFLLGLEESQEYDTSSALDGLLSYLPLWVSVYLESNKYPPQLPYIDISYFRYVKRDDIKNKIEEMDKDERAKRTRLELSFYSRDIDLYILYKSLLSIREKGVKKIHKSLANPDYSLVQGRSFHISEAYSKDTIIEMLRQFYSQRNIILRNFLKENGFPDDFMPNSNGITFVIPEFVSNSPIGPHLGITEIIAKVKKENAMLANGTCVILPASDEDLDLNRLFTNGFIYQDEKYEIVEWESRYERELFEEMPYYEYIYNKIESRIEELKNNLKE